MKAILKGISIFFMVLAGLLVAVVIRQHINGTESWFTHYVFGVSWSMLCVTIFAVWRFRNGK
jgi:hypothetical protein